jgi:hypothetical protein
MALSSPSIDFALSEILLAARVSHPPIGFHEVIVDSVAKLACGLELSQFLEVLEILGAEATRRRMRVAKRADGHRIIWRDGLLD